MRGFWLGVIATLVVMPFVGWLISGSAMPTSAPMLDLPGSNRHLRSQHWKPLRHATRPSRTIRFSRTEANLMDGARLYRDKCADCHGRPDNPDSDYGRSFYPRAPSS